MISGGYNKGKMPIPLFISDFRRKMIIQAMIGDNQKQKEKGKKIAQAFEKQMLIKKEKEKEDRGEEDDAEAIKVVSAAHIDELQQQLNSKAEIIKYRIS